MLLIVAAMVAAPLHFAPSSPSYLGCGMLFFKTRTTLAASCCPCCARRFGVFLLPLAALVWSAAASPYRRRDSGSETP